MHICERPYVPFVSITLPDIISTNTSGGAWTFIDINKLRYVGKRNKKLQVWGHCGPCANGAVQFLAEVSVWEYTDGEHEFTTKTHDKFHVQYLRLENVIIDSQINNGCIQECKRVIEGTTITTYFPYQNEKIVLENEKAYRNSYL